eukprot:15461786-Alexandrium_andersonii.AAC.1
MAARKQAGRVPAGGLGSGLPGEAPGSALGSAGGLCSPHSPGCWQCLGAGPVAGPAGSAAAARRGGVEEAAWTAVVMLLGLGPAGRFGLAGVAEEAAVAAGMGLRAGAVRRPARWKANNETLPRALAGR